MNPGPGVAATTGHFIPPYGPGAAVQTPTAAVTVQTLGEEAQIPMSSQLSQVQGETPAFVAELKDMLEECLKKTDKTVANLLKRLTDINKKNIRYRCKKKHKKMGVFLPNRVLQKYRKRTRRRYSLDSSSESSSDTSSDTSSNEEDRYGRKTRQKKRAPIAAAVETDGEDEEEEEITVVRPTTIQQPRRSARISRTARMSTGR